MKRKKELGCIILILAMFGFFPRVTHTAQGVAYGIVSRTLTSQCKIVIIPTHGKFIIGTEIQLYDSKGQHCCSGRVDKTYSDITYVSVEEEDIPKLKNGYLASFNGEEETIRELSSYSMNIKMVMENCIGKTHTVPPNDIVLTYIKEETPITFHHYSHNFRCDKCHHRHHEAIDTRCRWCHDSKTGTILYRKDPDNFRGNVKAKCLECHVNNGSIVAGWNVR